MQRPLSGASSLSQVGRGLGTAGVVRLTEKEDVGHLIGSLVCVCVTSQVGPQIPPNTQHLTRQKHNPSYPASTVLVGDWAASPWASLRCDLGLVGGEPGESGELPGWTPWGQEGGARTR